MAAGDEELVPKAASVRVFYHNGKQRFYDKHFPFGFSFFSSRLFLFVCLFVYVYVCVSVTCVQVLKKPGEDARSQQVVVSHLTRTLGTELGFSERAANRLQHRVISPELLSFFKTGSQSQYVA